MEQSGAGSTAPAQKLAVDLSFHQPLSRRMAIWGDVRLSSLPNQLQSTVVTLPLDTVKLASTVPISELVRSGEFLAGGSYRVLGGGNGWSSLSLIASVGAATPLAPDQNRFLRQYYAGMRAESSTHAHVVDVSVGQNEAVTGGGLTGTVVRLDGFYALPLTSKSFAYLFGTAIMRAWPGHTGADTGRDIYRVGAGIDLFQMIRALRSN
jgi:hypothetical protein